MKLEVVNINSAFGKTGYYIFNTKYKFIPVPVSVRIETLGGVYISRNETISGDGKTEPGITFISFYSTFEDQVKMTVSKNSALVLIGCRFGKNCTFYLEENATLFLDDKFESNLPEDNVSGKPNIFEANSEITIESGVNSYFQIVGQVVSSSDISFILKSENQTCTLNFNLMYLTDFEDGLEGKIIIDCQNSNGGVISPPVNINYLIIK